MMVVLLIGCPQIGDGGTRSAHAEGADTWPPDDRRPKFDGEIERRFRDYARLQGLRAIHPLSRLKPGAVGDFWKPGEFDRLIGRR
jgi:hypothetical protein